MKRLFEKHPVIFGIGTGYSLLLLFVVFEWCLRDFSSTSRWVYIDSGLRLCFGVGALLILKSIYAERFPALFTRKIHGCVWLYLVPVLLYLALEFALFACAKEISTAYLLDFLVVWIAEIATGLWEEAASRGILMSGMLQKWKASAKDRFATVLISGALFGSLHVLSFLYGKDIVSCLWSGLYTCCWGMFIAAIYLLSENLLLVMVIHAVWDIIVHIPDYLFVSGYVEGGLLTGIWICQDVIYFGAFPVLAIVICFCGFQKKVMKKVMLCSK